MSLITFVSVANRLITQRQTMKPTMLNAHVAARSAVAPVTAIRRRNEKRPRFGGALLMLQGASHPTAHQQ